MGKEAERQTGNGCAAVVGVEGRRCGWTASYDVVKAGDGWEMWPEAIGLGQYCRMHARSFVRALNLTEEYRDNLSPAAARPSPTSERG
jgi:hypothetical protein